MVRQFAFCSFIVVGVFPGGFHVVSNLHQLFFTQDAKDARYWNSFEEAQDYCVQLNKCLKGSYIESFMPLRLEASFAW